MPNHVQVWPGSSWDQQDLREKLLPSGKGCAGRSRPIGERAQKSSADFHSQWVGAPL